MKAVVKAVYAGDPYLERPDIMTDNIPDVGDLGDDSLTYTLTNYFGGVKLKSLGESGDFVDLDDSDEETDEEGSESDGDVTEVYWVTEMTKFTTVKISFIAYGNESSLEHMYGQVCLIVRLGPVSIKKGKCVRD